MNVCIFQIKKNIIYNKNKIRKLNLGIQLLRMILSFLIVLVHILRKTNSTIKIHKYLPYYVPCFFFISFFFSYNIFISNKILLIKKRLIRILIPYWGWSILIWLRNNYLFYRYDIKRGHSFKNIYYQLLIGCGVYGIFWFLFNLLLISIMFIIIILLFNKYYLYILLIITFLFYIFAYSKYGSIFFNLYNYIPVYHSISPIPKMFLFSFTGFFCASKNIIKENYKNRIIVLFSFGLLLFIILYYNILKKTCRYYQGLIIDLGSLSAFLFFAMIPLDKINNNIIFLFLNKITSYSGGIYYLHIIVYEILESYIISMRQKTFKGCIFLFLFCYLICLINSIIFRNSKIYYLFN